MLFHITQQQKRNGITCGTSYLKDVFSARFLRAPVDDGSAQIKVHFGLFRLAGCMFLSGVGEASLRSCSECFKYATDLENTYRGRRPDIFVED